MQIEKYARRRSLPCMEQIHAKINEMEACRLAIKKKTRAQSAQKSTSKPRASAQKNHSKKKKSENGAWLGTWLLAALGILFFACLVFTSHMGQFGEFIRSVLCGILGGGAYLLPPLLLIAAVFYKKDKEQYALGWKALFGSVIVIFSSALFHLADADEVAFSNAKGVFDTIGVWYTEGAASVGGGVVGGAAYAILRYTGTFGTVALSILAFFFMGLFYVGMTPKSLYVTLQYHYYKNRERREEIARQTAPAKQARREELERKEKELIALRRAAAQRQREERELRAAEARKASGKRGTIDDNVYANDMEEVPDEVTENTQADNADEPCTEVVSEAPMVVEETDAVDTAEARRAAVAAAHEAAANGASASESKEVDLSAIFANPKDEQLLRKYGPAQGSGYYRAQSAELELHVTRSTPDGLEAKTEAPITEPVPPTSTGDLNEDANALLTALGNLYGTSEADESSEVVKAEGTSDEKDDTPPPYLYPPTTLLKANTEQMSEDLSDELEENGEKLVGILRSFNVKTHIVNISRGPTVTRYELQPEAGTRVRSVANLVDDIALGMAASGVRMEAPIPGKSAIGIEIPNQTVSTVFIRDLIECDAFLMAKSRLTTCLGMDVAGAPVYLDIAKMPHLLICGATGSGKSVCINSLILSMLYKATPDEVKMLLIDPKKVEFNIYNGIPHLLVPVVSDPKKAAGSLHWAVTEMERRFELIEDVGMRDIRGYNEITKNDPDREHMCHIVIIIDELADLMMTAPDDVEENICRIAQKARAAGMHLVIGTQRPSVDVITGLIKANVPSRIAFRVSGQMDSRIVLDTAGAEKLLGYGDMLYAPVGAPKPQRVQGAYVSEAEIDRVITFLKKNAGQAEYADDVMESIEREAALCGQKKSARGAEDGADEDGAPEDPMLKNALELAVETGKISTSLIQRRLSLGYGRAAKLIDRMEVLGYVSAPEGQKPRQVLITKAQYNEMMLASDDIEE